MELIERLTDELGVTTEQAEGGAGLLLGFAQARLSESEFVRVADATVGISDIIAKAPRFEMPARDKLLNKLSRLMGGLGSLGPLAEPFARIRLDKQQISQFVAVLLAYFGESERGGVEVESLLFSVWH